MALNQFAKVLQLFDTVILKRSGLSVGEIVTANIGLLCTEKSDFVAIENHRNDGFYADALGISDSLAASILRIQMDARAQQIIPLPEHLSVNLLKAVNAPISPMACGLVACDIDVFTQHNSRTKKDGVSRTYAGTDGYAPIAVLVRWDSGFHAAHLSHQIEATSIARQAAGGEPIHFLVKGNPRRMDIQALHAQRIESQAIACLPGDGKRVWVWETAEKNCLAQQELKHCRIQRLIERAIDAKGQALLTPELEYEFWDTTLPAHFNPAEVIQLYQDHGTHEQFHGEFKTDLDLERLPSGKFDINDCVLFLAGVAYNVLRLIGQLALLGEDAPVRHTAKRRRLKTVIQEMICVSAKVDTYARSVILNFGRHCLAIVVFERLYGQWSAA